MLAWPCFSMGSMQTRWVVSAHPINTLLLRWQLGSHPRHHCFPEKWRGGKDGVFHSCILICESSLWWGNPRPSCWEWGKFSGNYSSFFHHSLVPTTQFPVTTAEGRSHGWWIINGFGKLDFGCRHLSQKRKKGRQREEGRDEERKEGRKKLETCGGREEKKAQESMLKTMVMKGDVLPGWSCQRQEFWVAFSSDRFSNEPQFGGLLESSKTSTCSGKSYTCVCESNHRSSWPPSHGGKQQ